METEIWLVPSYLPNIAYAAYYWCSFPPVDHAFGLVTLTNAQVNSVRCLLDRRLPSLRAMEVTGQADSNITISWQK